MCVCVPASGTCVRRPFLDNPAVIHEDDPIGDVLGELHLVRDDQHGHAVGGEVADHVQHLADQLGIERRRRLVEQHQPRLHGQRAGDRDALLLAAGQHRADSRRACARGRPCPAMSSAIASASARLPQHLGRSEHDVVQRGQVREQVEALEHHADAGADARNLPVRISTRRPPDRFSPIGSPSIRTSPSVGRSSQLMQRSNVVLPEPRRPDDRDFLAGADGKIDAVKTSSSPNRLVRPTTCSSGRRPASSDIDQANSDE